MQPLQQAATQNSSHLKSGIATITNIGSINTTKEEIAAIHKGKESLTQQGYNVLAFCGSKKGVAEGLEIYSLAFEVQLN